MERHELETVIYEKEGPIARIILNRPEKANAQSSAMVWDVENSLKDAEADYSIKVVIMKANGRGQPLTALRRAVPGLVGGPGSCTPLNDLMRSLADIPALMRAGALVGD